MNKGWQGNFFEDFDLGQQIACPTPRTVTSGDVSAYIALTGDRTARFCGPSGLLHPLVTFHVVFGQTVRHISFNARANLGYAGIRWQTPGRLGDTLSIDIEVVGLKENSNGKTGVVWVHNIARNQDGEVVLSFFRWVMVRKRGAEPTRWATESVVPEMPAQVAASDLVVSAESMPTQAQSGGRFAFEDYAAGERVLHYDGMGVNDSDHMSFTKLFQNSARVHFDRILTDGSPLVYGGVPISLGYALALNGFENRLGIAAINAGSHTNPLRGGDTVFAFTDVIECVDLPGTPAGALRLRMVCTKNLNVADESDPSAFEIQTPDPNRPGRSRYHSAVILDLDYWELMPKRASLR